MLKIDGNKTIHITRGDLGIFKINFTIPYSGYVLGPDSFVRLSVYEAGDLSNCIFYVDSYAGQTTNEIIMRIDPLDTLDNIEPINSPRTYWYEIEIDPGSNFYEKTPVGYDENGPKLFIVYPNIGDEVSN